VAELVDPGPPSPTIEEISSDIAATVAERRRSDTIARALTDRAQLQTDLDELLAAATGLAGAHDREAALQDDLDAARLSARHLREALDSARQHLTAADQAAAVAEDARRRAGDELHAGDELDEGTCRACGSTLTKEHLAAHRAQLAAELAAATGTALAAATAAEAAATALASASGDYDLAVERGQALREEHQAAVADVVRLDEIERRVDVLRRRLAEPAPEPVDTNELDARLDVLTRALDAAREQQRLHREALDAAEDLARKRAVAATDLARADQLDADARAEELDDDLARAADEHRANQEALARSREAVADAREVLATAAAATSAAQVALDTARTSARTRSEREHVALVAAHTKAVLKEVHELLSEGLRPQLETAATSLLARLSEGRFPAVSVSADYDVKVSDDGTFRPLGDLSGGETDLVALAIRLALAQVVADRRGSDALGLLVLDEVFGSQDASRRQAILVALRELRQIYGQIFLISHVGGLEDAADRVVDLALDEQRISHADER
jgi:exonuclease SbcC